MNNQKINDDTPTDITMTAPRPWIEPRFERIALQEALSSATPNFTDGSLYNS